MVDIFGTVMTGMRAIIIVIGLMGNALSFVIFSRPVFKKNSISTYCRALAISDCFVLIELATDIGILFYNGTFIATLSDTSCKLYYYFTLSLTSLPGWILVVFSIDKILNMMRKTAKFIKKRLFQYMILLAIVLIHFLMYIEVPIYLNLVAIDYGYDYIVSICDTKTLSFGNAIGILLLVEGNVIPFVIMFGSSIVIIKLIRDSRRAVEGPGLATVQRNKRDFKFAFTSLTFNIMFIVFKLPIVVLNAIDATYEINSYLLQISVFMYYLNYSSNFFVHLTSNSIFRKECLILFRLRRSNRIDSIHQPTLLTNFQTMKMLNRAK